MIPGRPKLSVTTLGRRPDLLPIIADWLWREFWQQDGALLAETRAIYAECTAETGAPQTFILLSDETPIGTATLARHDLDERPDLTPWLAGVFIAPASRGHGRVKHLLHAFDDACRAAAIDTSWLYTLSAARIYASSGWTEVETVARPGKAPVTLMRRDFA